MEWGEVGGLLTLRCNLTAVVEVRLHEVWWEVLRGTEVIASGAEYDEPMAKAAAERALERARATEV